MKKIIHITNYDYLIEVKSEKELLKYLNDQRNIYMLIKEKIEPTLTTQAGKDLISEI